MQYALVETNLPVLSDGIPHSHLPRVTCGHQLVTDKEEGIYRNTKAEHSLNNKVNKEVTQSPSLELVKT